MKIGKLFLLGFFLLLLLSVNARAGKYGAEFLKIGVSPRAAGLGGAFVAVPGDGTGFLWNPAGISGAGRELHLFSAAQFGSFANPLGWLDHAGISLPVRKATIAFNYVRFSVDDIPIYPELKGENIAQRLRDPALRPDGTPEGYLGDVEQAFVVSFAKNSDRILDLGWLYHKFHIGVPFGFNLKILHSRIGTVSASGLGLDMGFQFRLSLGEFFDSSALGKISFGLAWSNFTQNSLTWSTHHHDVLNHEILWGLAYSQPLRRWGSQLLMTFQRRSSEKAGFGLEWNLKKRLQMRLGGRGKQLTVGAGLRFWKISVGYALETHELNPSHRVGILYRF